MNGLEIVSLLLQMPYGDNKLNIAKLMVSSGLTIRDIAGNFSLFGGVKISDIKNDENQTKEYKEKLGNKVINFLKTGKQQKQLSFEEFIKNNSEFKKNSISLNQMINELREKKFSEKFKEQRVYIDFLLDSINSLKPTPQTSEVGLISPKNVFKVTPKQSVDKKAKTKAKISTKYIGFADGINGSSTALYAGQAGNVANTGDYNSNDVVFVSVPGKRGNAEVAKSQQDKTIKEAIKAVESGATIITDNKAYTDSSSYNTGEKRLYANMEAKGYSYSEVKVDGQTLGTWSKSPKPTQQTSEVKKATPIASNVVKFEGESYTVSDNFISIDIIDSKGKKLQVIFQIKTVFLLKCMIYLKNNKIVGLKQ